MTPQQLGMYEPLLGEVEAAARVLYYAAPKDREDLLIDMFTEAREGFAAGGHIVYGKGYLGHQALRRNPVGHPPLSDPDFIDCLQMVLAEVRAQYVDRMAVAAE